MNLKELYKKEKGLNVELERGRFGFLFYDEDYVKWLESKIKHTHCYMEFVCDCGGVPTSQYQLETGEILCCKCDKPKAN